MPAPTAVQFSVIPQRGDPDFTRFSNDVNTFVSEFPVVINSQNALADWMNQQGAAMESLRTEFQGYASDASDSASDAANSESNALTSRNEAEQFKNQAEAAVATLPEGTINDKMIEPDKVWSSAYINELLTIEDSMSMKSDFVRDEHFVDDGDRTFGPSWYVWQCERSTPKYVEGPSGKLSEIEPNKIARQWRNGVSQGALVEDAATNLLTATNSPTSWNLVGGAILESHTVINGVARAVVRLPSSGSRVSFGYGGTLSGVYTASARLRLISGYTENSLVISMGSASEFTQYVTAEPGIWNEISRTSEINGTGEVAILRRNSSGGGDIVVEIEGQQLETGTRPSSYIPTTNAPATRAADNIYRELGGEFNASEGTFYFNLRINDGYPSNAPPNIISFNNGFRLEISPSGILNVDLRNFGGSIQGTGLSVSFGDLNKISISYTNENLIFGVNGEGSENIPINQSVFNSAQGAWLGSRSGTLNFINSSVIDFKYLPRALSPEQLARLTQ